METEQLQMLFEMLRDLGADGKQAFIAWLLIDGLIPVLGWLVGVGATCITVFRIFALFANGSSSMCALRDELGIGAPGDLTRSERDAVFTRVRQLVRDEAARSTS